MERKITRRRALVTAGFTLTATQAGCLRAFNENDGSQSNNSSNVESQKSIQKTATWPMNKGGPQKRGYSEYGVEIQSPKVSWRTDFAAEYFEITSPIASENRVYFGVSNNEKGKILSIDGSSGDRVWQSNMDPKLRADPATDGEVVVFASEGGKIKSFATDSGEMVWESELDERHYSFDEVIISNDVVLVTEGDGVFAFDIDTGKTAWPKEPDNRVTGTTRVVVQNQEAYFLDSSNTIYSLDLQSGEENWTYSLFDGAHILGVENGLIITEGNKIALLDVESRQKYWSSTVSEYIQDISTDGNDVFIGTKSTIYVLDLTDGSEKRSISVNSQVEELVIAGDLIYASTDEGVYAIGQEDQVQWTLAGESHPSMAITTHQLYVCNQNNGVSAFQSSK
jgi:outer membrane protein assembly factor BamB